MRTSTEAALVAILAGGALAGCADTPIEAAYLRPDGQLRPTVYRQAGFSVVEEPKAQRPVTLSAVLAAEAHGKLADRSSFTLDEGAVHLHLRADGLSAPRTVVLRWSRPGLADASPRETLGVLGPEAMLRRMATLRLGPDSIGRHRVEVLGLPVDGEPPPVLFSRDFEVLPSTGPPEAP